MSAGCVGATGPFVALSSVFVGRPQTGSGMSESRLKATAPQRFVYRSAATILNGKIPVIAETMS